MTNENHLKELEHLSEKMLVEMLERGYVPAQIEKLQGIDCANNAILVFQLQKQLPHDVRANMIRNFETWLQRHNCTGIFLPPDLNLVAILNKPAIENVLIEQEEKEITDVNSGA